MNRAGLVFVAFAFAFGCGGSTQDAPRGTDPGAPSGSTSSSGGPATACDGRVSDVAVASNDLNGYPPYALTGCTLLYVGTNGALVEKDLTTGAETLVAPAEDRPRRPAASADVIAWEGFADGNVVVRVRNRKTRETRTVEGPFVSSTEPRVSGELVSFTAWLSATEADVWLYDARAHSAKSIFSGPGEQRFSDISAQYVVATDFSEDPDGKYDGAGDLADIVLFDLGTGLATKRVAEKKQAFPMLVNDSLLGYLEWSLVHPEPKLEGYAIRVGRIAGPAVEDVTIADVVLRASEPIRPSTANGMIEWIANPDGTTALWRAPADRSSAPAKVAGLEGLVLFAPTSTAGFTLLASVPADRSDAAPSLRAVAR